MRVSKHETSRTFRFLFRSLRQQIEAWLYLQIAILRSLLGELVRQERQLILALVSVLALTIALYSSVFTAGYVWDDKTFFVNSASLRSYDNVFRAMADPIIAGALYFRPLGMLSYIAEFSIFGPNATVSHSINLLIHLFNITLLALIVHSLLKSEPVKNYGLFMFAVLGFYAWHPALIEPTIWISARFDLLLTFFVSLAVLVTLTNTSRFRFIWVSICFFLALSSKETAIVFLAIWIALIWFKYYPHLNLVKFTQRLVLSHWFEFAALLGCAAAYLFLRSISIDSGVTHDVYVVENYSLFQRLQLIVCTVWFYFKLAFVPFIVELSPFHFRADHINIFNTACGAILSSFILGAGVYLTYRLRSGLLFFLLGFICLLPVLNIIPLKVLNNIAQDRYLTLPLIFFCLAISKSFFSLNQRVVSSQYSYSLSQIWKYRGLVVVFFLGFSALNIVFIAPRWQSDFHLWTWAYSKHPNRPVVQANLISAMLSENRLDLAYNTIEEISSQYGGLPLEAKIPEAEIYLRLGRFDQALGVLHMMDQIIPAHHDKEEQLRLTKNSGQATWRRRALHLLFAWAYMGKGEYELALEHTDTGLFYQDDNPPLHLRKSIVLIALGQTAEAKKSFKRAVDLFVPEGRTQALLLLQLELERLCNIEQWQSLNPKTCTNKEQFYLEFKKIALAN